MATASDFEKAFLHHEVQHAAAVLAETWGYPKPHTKYPFKMLIAHTEQRVTLSIRDNTGRDLSNPFFWEDVAKVLFQQYEWEEGHLYWFDGYYWVYKNGNCRFSGTITEAYVEEI